MHSNCPCVGFVEVRHRGPLGCQSSIGICSISGVFSWRRQVWGDFPGLCKILHETTPLGWYGTTWDSRRAYLSFAYFCRYRFELVLLHVFW